MASKVTKLSGLAAKSPWGKERPMSDHDRAGETPAAETAQATAEAAWQAPSWEEVVTQHSARVYRLAYRLTGNPHDAEDLTQEVFVRVFRSLSSYTPGTFEGWLHRITTNLFLDQARRKSKIRFDALGEDADQRMPGRVPSPDTQVAEGMLDDDIEAALADLPPEFRAAVVLCDIEGLTYDEIADVLDAKLGTVRSRIHRGRKMLRTSLAHRAPARGRVRYSGPVDSDDLAPQRV
jgi:RNA polymerase sigma-70 factor (ECF subfamily)